jgi:uncharacterized protein (DUF3820 family)
MLQKIAQFQIVVKSALKEGQDFGVIPGTDKPTLLKPGAEKALMLLGVTSEYSIIEKVENYEDGFFAYTLKCTLYKNGQKITEGVGHCNTREGKYRYRWVNENKLPEGISTEDMKKEVKQGQYGQYVRYRLENDDPYTVANTVLKMAKKRAQVDATLTVACLSDIFTQDIEDMQDFANKEQVETMNNADAMNIKLTFGKHKGKTLKEINEEAPDYIEWLSKGDKTDPAIKKACEMIMQSTLNSMTGSNSQQTKGEIKDTAKCAVCGQSSDIVDYTRKKFGKVLCKSCMQKNDKPAEDEFALPDDEFDGTPLA